MNSSKQTNIKNCTCCYFHGIIKNEGFNFDNILLDEKSHGNSLIYDISYKTLIDVIQLRLRFDITEGFVRVYGGTRYLILFGGENYAFIYNRISNKSYKN